MDVPPLGQEGQFTGLPIGAPPVQGYHWSTQLMPVVQGTHHPVLMSDNNLNQLNGILPSSMGFSHPSTDYEHVFGGQYHTDYNNLHQLNGIPPPSMGFPHGSTDHWQGDTGTNMDTRPF
ncbi:hypothetical protein H0H93_000328 [Arthromyces matolae]|nr:hypothetical protein H0H93_000328 [Arthromyces matolae]